MVMTYMIQYHKQALKDIEKLKSAHLSDKAKTLVELIKNNPLENPPPFECLVGNLHGKISRRINIQHRLVYEVLEEEKVIRILRMWSHYE